MSARTRMARAWRAGRCSLGLVLLTACGSSAPRATSAERVDPAPAAEAPPAAVPDRICAEDGVHWRLHLFRVAARTWLEGEERARLDMIDLVGTRGADLAMLLAATDRELRRLVPLELEAAGEDAWARRLRELAPLADPQTIEAARGLLDEAHEALVLAADPEPDVRDYHRLQTLRWVRAAVHQLASDPRSRVEPEADPDAPICMTREEATSDGILSWESDMATATLEAGAPREAVVAETLAMLEAMAEAAREELTAARAEATRSPRDRAASAMEALFAACRDGDLRAAASHVVYRGPDRARRWVSPTNPDAPDEAQYVQGVCGRIAALLQASSRHEKIAYESQRESEGVWHVWQVRFDTAQRPVTQAFAFLEVQGRFLLGDID